jgi:uncharacterized protein YkwD
MKHFLSVQVKEVTVLLLVVVLSACQDSRTTRPQVHSDPIHPQKQIDPSTTNTPSPQPAAPAAPPQTLGPELPVAKPATPLAVPTEAPQEIESELPVAQPAAPPAFPMEAPQEVESELPAPKPVTPSAAPSVVKPELPAPKPVTARPVPPAAKPELPAPKPVTARPVPPAAKPEPPVPKAVTARPVPPAAKPEPPVPKPVTARPVPPAAKPEPPVPKPATLPTEKSPISQRPFELTKSEARMAHLLNEYRVSLGQKRLAVSKDLTTVARTHVTDLNQNYSFINSNGELNSCNMHSWSAKGSWQPCCYTNDHAKAKCIWDKPRELTGYRGNGYEIAYGTRAPTIDKAKYGFEFKDPGCSVDLLSAEAAIEGWKKSSAHNAVMINKGNFERVPFAAIGVAINGCYATIWFGKESDPVSIDPAQIK